ncbi:MAG: hypothetical protein GY800_08505 [Planctomycetes bacterium]|nr:hypothetical protein [Planctomycetota bacterium]
MSGRSVRLTFIITLLLAGSTTSIPVSGMAATIYRRIRNVASAAEGTHSRYPPPGAPLTQTQLRAR